MGFEHAELAPGNYPSAGGHWVAIDDSQVALAPSQVVLPAAVRLQGSRVCEFCSNLCPPAALDCRTCLEVPSDESRISSNVYYTLAAVVVHRSFSGVQSSGSGSGVTNGGHYTCFRATAQAPSPEALTEAVQKCERLNEIGALEKTVASQQPFAHTDDYKASASRQRKFATFHLVPPDLWDQRSPPTSQE